MFNFFNKNKYNKIYDAECAELIYIAEVVEVIPKLTKEEIINKLIEFKLYLNSELFKKKIIEQIKIKDGDKNLFIKIINPNQKKTKIIKVEFDNNDSLVEKLDNLQYYINTEYYINNIIKVVDENIIYDPFLTLNIIFVGKNLFRDSYLKNMIDSNQIYGIPNLKIYLPKSLN